MKKKYIYLAILILSILILLVVNDNSELELLITSEEIILFIVKCMALLGILGFVKNDDNINKN